MSYQFGRTLDNLPPEQYMHIALEKTMSEIGLAPAYDLIYQINVECSKTIKSLDLVDSLSVELIVEQIENGKLDKPLKKFFVTLEANYHFNKIDYSQFKRLFIHELTQVSNMDLEDINHKNEILETIKDFYFGNIKKIIASRYYEIEDDFLRWIYFQTLEAYERTLILIDEKHKDDSIAERVELLAQVRFPNDPEEFEEFYKKNISLKESYLAVQKLESIAIFNRMLSEGAHIDISMISKEALVNWRNEISDLTKTAKEEKRRIKEDEKKKKINITDGEVDILFNDVLPRFLQNKNLKSILVEIKAKYSDSKSKKLFISLLQQINPVENEVVKLLSAEDLTDDYKHFDRNPYEGKAILYFVLLYKALLDNNIDFLLDIVKNSDEHYRLRIAARKLFFIKMVQNSKIKNPVGENRIYGAFLTSFERIIMYESESLSIRQDNLLQFSKLVLKGFPEFSDQFNSDMSDLFIKIYTHILDINLLNKFANLKKMSDKEKDAIELLKNAAKLYDAIVKELKNQNNKSRDQVRRNEFLLQKVERKLSSSIKKIKEKAVILN